MGEKRKLFRVMVGKPEGRRPLGRPRRRWEYEIRMALTESGWGGAEWIKMTQDSGHWRAILNAVMNRQVLALRS
jgi:hypothetical protein